MNAETAPPPFKPRGPGPGCFLKGCLALFIVFMIMGVIIGALGYYLYSAALPFMSAQPGHIQVSAATPEQYQALIDRLKTFSDALDAGQAATVELTADDLDTLIARDPRFEDARGRLYLSIVNGQLVADISTPIGAAQLSGPPVYFTGRLTMDASVTNGDLAVVLRHVEGVNGRQLPPMIGRIVADGGFAESFEQGTHNLIQAQGRLSGFLDRIKSARIENNRIVVTCGAQEPSEATPTPTPTPNPGVVCRGPLSAVGSG